MPLPIFPTEEGVPGDGNLIAVYGGSPATVEVIGGLIEIAQVVEAYPVTGVTVPTSKGYKFEPLIGDGVTIWLRGSLRLNIRGEPTTTDYADMLSRWTTVRDKLRLTNYELFLYYRSATPQTYRKYRMVNTVLLRSYWNNLVTISYTLAAVTTDKTLYLTPPGA